METRAEKKPGETLHYLADPRLEQLLVVGRQMNDLRTRIRAATDYILGGGEKKDVGEVEFAREELVRDLDKNFNEANQLLPIVDEIIGKYQEQLRTLDNARRLNAGLARIEKLSGSNERSRDLAEVAESESAQIRQLENLVAALDALQEDLSTRRKESIGCPRCSSRDVSYRIQPSELGFSLYKCNSCANSWKTTVYHLKF